MDARPEAHAGTSNQGQKRQRQERKTATKAKAKNKKLLNVQVDRIDELNPVVEQPVNGLISIDKEMIEIVIGSRS